MRLPRFASTAAALILLAGCSVVPALKAPVESPAAPPPIVTPPPAERKAETAEALAPAPAASSPAVSAETPVAPPPAEPAARPKTPLPKSEKSAIATPRLPRPPVKAPDKPGPQTLPGDNVEVLAAEHGFVPIPNVIPEDTRFARLRLGMTKQDAEALLGRPDRSLHYANEGARIPFYASDDSSRWETFYRGQGRLMFSGAWLTGEVRLIRIEYDPKEDGRR